MLHALCKSEHPELLIGTSMGGMFAGLMKRHKKILVNPAFHVSEFMRTQLGVREFLNSRQNGEIHFEITPRLCDEYLQLENYQFENISDFDKANTYALFGKNDI